MQWVNTDRVWVRPWSYLSLKVLDHRRKLTKVTNSAERTRKTTLKPSPVCAGLDLHFIHFVWWELNVQLPEAGDGNHDVYAPIKMLMWFRGDVSWHSIILCVVYIPSIWIWSRLRMVNDYHSARFVIPWTISSNILSNDWQSQICYPINYTTIWNLP